MKSLIFVVDNQTEVCEFTRQCLESAGYAVRLFSGAEADSEAKLERPALMIVGMDSYNCGNLCAPAQLFATSLSERVPWIVLLNDGLTAHRQMALESGADDCIVKPFSARELVARVRALLRRSSFPDSVEHTDMADIVIDSWAMKLLVRGNEIPATALEFRLLEYLARHRGQVFTRDFLLDAVWGNTTFVNPRSVDACIRRIREKIETDSARPTMLKTVRGVGYRMDAAAVWQSAPAEICDCPACRTRMSALRFHELGLKRRRAFADSRSDRTS